MDISQEDVVITVYGEIVQPNMVITSTIEATVDTFLTAQISPS